VDLSQAHILVTGGAGFIGSHLTDRLIESGAKVRILDNLLTGDRQNLNPKAEFIEGDIRDQATVEKALDGIDVVYHLAAQINPAKAVEDPMFDFDINVKGTLVLLLAAVEKKIQKFVMASTNLYGNADVPEMKESFPTLATRGTLLSPYAAAKASAETYLKVANDELGLPTVRCRFTNVFGPRQLTKSESGVIAIFTKLALQNKDLKIFGDGQQTRDFVFISDLVSGLIAAGQSEEANGGVYNLGIGVETSIAHLAERIRDLCKADIKIEFAGERAADFRRIKPDLTLSKQILGYEPKVSLDEGLALYIDWYRETMLPKILAS
jgi:UDP-glucose 4-epimerase